MERKQAIILTVLALAFLFAACSAGKKSDSADEGTNTADNITATVTAAPEGNDNAQALSAENEFQPVDVSAGGWDIIIENTLRDSSMKNAATVLGYTDTTTNEFVQEAPEGKEYFLIKLKISKADSKETIKWDNLTLTDSDNNAYHRAEDIFIDDLGMKRIPGTDLNFGSNEGWIAFEINEGAEGLTLQYPFENDALKYTFE